MIKEQEYRDKNRERFTTNRAAYYLANKERENALHKIWCEENADRILEYSKEYHEKNYDLLAEKRKTPEFRKKNTLRARERSRTDIQYRLRNNLRSRIYGAIKAKDSTKYLSSMELVGCSIEFLKSHLESQFTEGMSWENYGFRGWHVDHIKPCALFDLTSEEQQKICFHFSNLQPLWWRDNLSKNDSYEEDYFDDDFFDDEEDAA